MDWPNKLKGDFDLGSIAENIGKSRLESILPWRGIPIQDFFEWRLKLLRKYLQFSILFQEEDHLTWGILFFRDNHESYLLLHRGKWSIPEQSCHQTLKRQFFCCPVTNKMLDSGKLFQGFLRNIPKKRNHLG